MLLKTFSERLPENARRAQDDYFGVQNSRKAMWRRIGRAARSENHGRETGSRAGAAQSVSEPSRATTAVCRSRAVLRPGRPRHSTCWRTIRVQKMLLEDTLGLRLQTVRHRPRGLALCRRNGQAQCRAAAGISRVESRIAQAGDVFAGADLRRSGNAPSGRWACRATWNWPVPTIRWW